MIANPIPESAALTPDFIDGTISDAVREAEERGIGRKELTPFLLARINELSKGESLKANIEPGEEQCAARSKDGRRLRGAEEGRQIVQEQGELPMNQQMNSYETILYEKDPADKFATITINRPDKMNAMNKTVIREIDAAVAAAVADPDVNALVITGAGRAFSSGYDLQGDDFDVDIDFWRVDMTENAEALLNIWRAPIPVIASVNGYALAGALELMMCCDLAIAADNAKFGEPEVRHNSGPPALMMPWLLATRDVRWLMFTGDMVDAEEALRMHLINKIVPADHSRKRPKTSPASWPACPCLR